jgi:hypothetical protein
VWQSGNSGGGLGPLVDFYSKLPKGHAPARFGGIKGRFFSGKNASAGPALAIIGGLFLIGYTMDYQRASAFFFRIYVSLNVRVASAVHLSAFDRSFIH